MSITREIANRQLERLHYMRIEPAVIVAVGMEVDYAAKQLKKRYAKANVITSMPEGKHTADLIFSNLVLYRSPDIGQMLLEFAHVLKPEGLLLFTTLGPDTFKELNAQNDSFFDMHDIGDALIHCQLLDPVMDMEFITLHYSSREPLQDDLNLLGLTLNVQTVPCETTIELIYGHAWGCAEKNTAILNKRGEVVVSLDAIRRESLSKT